MYFLWVSCILPPRKNLVDRLDAPGYNHETFHLGKSGADSGRMAPDTRYVETRRGEAGEPFPGPRPPRTSQTGARCAGESKPHCRLDRRAARASWTRSAPIRPLIARRAQGCPCLWRWNMNDFRMETTRQLKVCEACGGLWVRQGQHGRYCARCTHWLSEFPLPRGPRPGGRRRRPAARVPSAAPAGGGTQ